MQFASTDLMNPCHILFHAVILYLALLEEKILNIWTRFNEKLFFGFNLP